MAGLCTRADIPAWDSITDGTTLYSGGYVTHNGHYWLCQRRHVKTAQTAPGIHNPLWLDAPLIEYYDNQRRAALKKIRARKRLF
ncbi:MAG: hypothetical protein EOM66_11270 [Clostridia bacterium]|nr:hypothetical protein [Clostridia bacterium]